MKKVKILLIILFAVTVLGTIFLYFNSDNFAYVGSIDIVEVNCTKIDSLLDMVYESDQRIRKFKTTDNGDFTQMAKEDHRNQELVISIIEKCGMPTLEEVNELQMNAIWLGLQHSNEKYRKKYFPQIEKAVNKGDLNKSHYALMKDRMLMDEGEPQLYGSQLKNGKLYKLDSPETVNVRRKEMGLEPIEEYLKNFNIEYKYNE